MQILNLCKRTSLEIQRELATWVGANSTVEIFSTNIWVDDNTNSVYATVIFREAKVEEPPVVAPEPEV